MSLSPVTPDTDAVTVPTRPKPAGAGRRCSLGEPPRLPLPLTGTLIFAAIRVLSVAIAAFILGHGKFHASGWSLARWLEAGDGGHYRDIAAHGYAYPAGQLAHASVFSWFPGYPAAIDSIAWLPGVTVVSAGLIVTALARLAAAWGLPTLGMNLTANPRISLLLCGLGSGCWDSWAMWPWRPTGWTDASGSRSTPATWPSTGV